MSKRQLISRQVPLLIVWLILSGLIWSYVFNIINDTDAAHKLTIYADTEVRESTRLNLFLEEGRGEGIRMVRVHPFTYAMMSSEELTHADLYIMTESDLTAYAEWLTPVPDSLREGRILWTDADGKPCGIRLTGCYDAALGWFPYAGDETLWLAFGGKSLHLSGADSAVDNEAEACALRLLSIPGPDEKP